MNVVALHRPARVSGVSTAGLHAAFLDPPWRPLVIGPDLTEADLAQTPLAAAPNAMICPWPAEADPVEQVLRVRDALRALHADVVVPNDLPHGFAAAALDHHRGLRCAAWLHSASHDGEALVTSCFELADAWRAVSHEGRRRAQETAEALGLSLPPARAIAPGFLSVPDAAPPLPPLSPLRMLYAGKLEKHHKRVLDLAALCAQMRVPFHLTLAGDGPAEAELRAAIAPHAGNVTLLGPTSPKDMPALFASHHVLLLVSASEAAPLCVMEAMAHARPAAITASCGEASRWVRDGVDGVIVPTGDMAALGERLSSLSFEALDAMSRAAHQRAGELFSARSRGPALQALIEEAAAAPQDHNHQRRWTRLLHALAAIGPVSPDRVQALADAWRAELGEDLDLPLSVTPRPTPAERRLTRAVQTLAEEGRTRLALYGAGLHTRRVERTIASIPSILAIIDDNAGKPHGPPATLAGKPVLPPSAYPSLNADALILSSDEHEREMLARARPFADRVVPLYQTA